MERFTFLTRLCQRRVPPNISLVPKMEGSSPKQGLYGYGLRVPTHPQNSIRFRKSSILGTTEIRGEKAST